MKWNGILEWINPFYMMLGAAAGLSFSSIIEMIWKIIVWVYSSYGVFKILECITLLLFSFGFSNFLLVILGMPNRIFGDD